MTHLDLLQVDLEDGGEAFHIGVLVNGDKDLVEQGFEIVSLHSVHDEPLVGVAVGVVSVVWHSHLEWGNNDGVFVCYGDYQVHQPSVVEPYKPLHHDDIIYFMKDHMTHVG